MKKSAGILIIQGNKMLVCHPTNHKWVDSYSIPKGEIDEGEDLVDAAIRETFEEVGILVPRSEIENEEPYSVDKANGRKRLYYYIVRFPDGKYPDRLPKAMLQLDEIDWAGFEEKDEAYKRLHPFMKPLTKHI